MSDFREFYPWDDLAGGFEQAPRSPIEQYDDLAVAKQDHAWVETLKPGDAGYDRPVADNARRLLEEARIEQAALLLDHAELQGILDARIERATISTAAAYGGLPDFQ